MSSVFGWFKGSYFANSWRSGLNKPRRRSSTPLPSSTFPQALKKTASLNGDDQLEDQVIIAVIGWTGTGKSLFISKATGADIHIGHDLDLCTREISAIQVSRPEKCNRDVVFLDTPGFDDVNSDAEILEMLLNWLDMRYQRKVTLAGLLYLHRISDNRILGTPLKNLRKFRELCGKDALRKIILVTTMWSEVDEEMGFRREQELKEKYWKAMIAQGSGMARFGGALDSETAWAIIDPILQAAHRK